MNSLNLLSARVIGSAASRPRSKSQGNFSQDSRRDSLLPERSYSDEKVPQVSKDFDRSSTSDTQWTPEEQEEDLDQDIEDEKVPLLSTDVAKEIAASRSRLQSLIKRIADAINSILVTISAPVVYLAKYFEGDDGHYSLLVPAKRISRARKNRASATNTATAVGLSSSPLSEIVNEKPSTRVLRETKLKHSYSSDTLTSTTSESESGSHRPNLAHKKREQVHDGPRRASIRIKEQNSEALRKRKEKRNGSSLQTPMAIDNIKSPTSPSSKVTKYPHAPQPPRPLVPRRMPSYTNILSRMPMRQPAPSADQKTLVLDLDETLIHSMAKGGRMSTGHMVEVKLNHPVSVASTHSGQPAAVLGPQHPILYYVHKRPHCDEFLKKICKWYKLVIFTASVQEYADPVIDWLELERKYFSGRYYRQHCTYRNGTYVKDLSSIEPDLSKVIILDNSPVSYVFHEDNAIPIEGWINDPTDNDLLHLIPMFEALQYVTDVRALLALRRGEAEAS